MKILIAADLHPQHNFIMQRKRGLLSGLRDHTVEFMDILDFNGNQQEAAELQVLMTDSRMRRDYFDRQDLRDLNRRFLAQVLSKDWQVLWLCTIAHFSHFLLPPTLRTLRARGRVIGFMGDDELLFDFNRFWCPLFDAVVGYTEREVKSYRKWCPAAHLLPVGVPLVDPAPAEAGSGGVVFVGRPYGNRASLLRRLARADIPISIYGSNQWRGIRGLGGSYRGFLDRDDFWDVLRGASIILNLMEDQAGVAHINAKVFEAAAAGSMAITRRYDPFYSTYGLREGEDIASFDTADSLMGKISRYLDEPEERARMAASLQTRLKEFHYDRLYARLAGELLADNAPSGHTAPPAGGLRSTPSQGGQVVLDPDAWGIAGQAVRAGVTGYDGFQFDSILPDGRRLRKTIFCDAQSVLWFGDNVQAPGVGSAFAGRGASRVFPVLGEQVVELLERAGLRSPGLLSFAKRAAGLLGPDLVRVPVWASEVVDLSMATRLRRWSMLAEGLHRARDRVLGWLHG